MGKPEGKIENYLVKRCKEYGCLCYKFTSPSNAGVPDRIIIGHGKTVFVELKAPGQKPRALQEVVIGKLQEAGADVYVVDTKDGVNDLMSSLFPDVSPVKVPTSRRSSPVSGVFDV